MIHKSILDPPWQTTAASSVAPQLPEVLYWHCNRVDSDPWQLTSLSTWERLVSRNEPLVTAIAPDDQRTSNPITDYRMTDCKYATHQRGKILVVCRSQWHLDCPRSRHTLCRAFPQHTPPPCLWLVHLWCSMHYHSLPQSSVSQSHQYRMLNEDQERQYARVLIYMQVIYTIASHSSIFKMVTVVNPHFIWCTVQKWGFRSIAPYIVQVDGSRETTSKECLL